MVSEPPNELQVLKESLELTVKTQTVWHVNSVFDQHNSLMEEFSTSIASFWVSITLLLHLFFVLISLILSFFVFIIIYPIIVITYLVINLLMSYVDVYTEAIVISICIP